MDSFVIKAIINELRSWINPGLIKMIVQTDTYTLWLKIKGKRTNWLVISTKSPFTCMYSTSDKPEKTAFETPFSLALSKKIIGGEIIEVSVEELERVIKFDIIPRKAGYRLQRQILIIELIEHNTGLFLIEANNNRILASSRMDKKNEKQILPGELYKPLPSLSKHNPFKMVVSEWKALFLKRPPDEELSHYLVNNLLGLSPMIAEEIVFRARLTTQMQSNTVLLVDRLWNSLQEILSEYGSLSPHPVVIDYPDCDDLPVLASLPLKSKSDRGNERIFSKMNEAAAYYYKIIDQILAFRKLKADLSNLIRRVQKKYNKRLDSLEKDFDMLRKADESKYYGDLLMANLQYVIKGMSEINLPDFYHEGKEAKIMLDPAKSAIQNAQSYFKRYTKAKRGLKILTERKAGTENSLHQLFEAESKLAKAKDLIELREIEDSLRKILSKREMIKHKGTPSKSLTYGIKKGKMFKGVRFFKIDDTWDVLVGKTDKANDRLTRDLAKSEDVWFHVYDASGSHVVLKNPRRLDNIPFEIIKKAAGVAAFFSRKRDEEKVLVVYTRKKYVRKPKGMKIGQVLLERQKTILIQPTLNGVNPKTK